MRVSIERVVSEEDSASFYPTYVRGWESLLTRTAARHVLSEAEFGEEMADPRVEKFVVREDDGRAVAVTTLTTDLSAMEWVNPDYYRARFPDAVERGALFYLGFTLVDRTRRRSSALMLMASEVNRRVSAARGVVAFDISAYNDAHGIGRYTTWLFGDSGAIDRLDTQTYYAADYREQAVADPEPVVGEPAGLPVGAPSGRLHQVTLAERPDLFDHIGGVLAMRWPAFMLASRPAHGLDVEALVLAAPDLQVLVVDEHDQVQGVGLSLPLAWDGSGAGLPAGVDDAVERSAALLAGGDRADAAFALSVTVSTSAAGRGVAGQIITGLRAAAARAGAHALLAPIRPLLKTHYPLVDLADYVGWRTEEGRVFDPWLRLHLRLGGELAKVSPTSTSRTGTVQEWQEWTGERLPGPGRYLVPGALAPLEVSGGTGTYVEPHVWVTHRLVPGERSQLQGSAQGTAR